MRRLCRDRHLTRRGDDRVEHLHPVDRRAVLLFLLDLGGVDERERKFTGDEQPRKEAVPAALLRLLRGERAHIGKALVAAPVVEHGCIPLHIALIERELAHPWRREQVPPALRRLLHEPRVVADHILAHVDGRPAAVRIDSARRISGSRFRGSIGAEQPFAVQRLDIEQVERHHVPGVAPGARLGKDARAHLLAGRAQDGQREEWVALDERLLHRFGIRHVHRGVPDYLALAARLVHARLGRHGAGGKDERESGEPAHGTCRALCYI